MQTGKILPESQPANFVPGSPGAMSLEGLTFPDVNKLLRSSRDTWKEAEGTEEEQPSPTSTHNARVFLAGSSAVIRVVLERYPDGNVLASLVGDPSVCAVGDQDEAAIRELIRFMMTDLAELSTYAEEELSEGAKRRREMLRRLLGGPAR